MAFAISLTKPSVSVAIAAFNASATIEASVRSVTSQSLRNLEVIIVDDRSTDDTIERVMRLAAVDQRIRVESLACNSGPAAARNRALSVARGRWFAVLDSDDIFASTRLETLTMRAEAVGADMICDNLLVFDDVPPHHPHAFLTGAAQGFWIDARHYLRRTRIFGRGSVAYGYLKPVMRLDGLRSAGIRYNESLRIGEDDEFVVRALAAGLRYWFEPKLTYGYRKHAASISHRLRPADAAAMRAANDALLADPDFRALTPLVRARGAALLRAELFARSMDHLKNGRFAEGLSLMAAHPSTLPLLRMPVAGAARRILGPRRGRRDAAAEEAFAAMTGA